MRAKEGFQLAAKSVWNGIDKNSQMLKTVRKTPPNSGGQRWAILEKVATILQRVCLYFEKVATILEKSWRHFEKVASTLLRSPRATHAAATRS